MSITIRAFQASDLDAAITLFQGAVRQIASQDYNPEQIDAWVQVDRTAWEKRFKESQCWLAIRNGELAGFGNVEYDGHLDMLFTDPRHQALRCGNRAAKVAGAGGSEDGHPSYLYRGEHYRETLLYPTRLPVG